MIICDHAIAFHIFHKRIIIFIAISVFSTMILLAVPHKLTNLRQAIVVIIESLGVSSSLIGLLFMDLRVFFYGRKTLVGNITYGVAVELVRFLDILLNNTAYFDPTPSASSYWQGRKCSR